MTLADLWYALLGCALFLHVGLAAIDLGVCLISLSTDSKRAESMLASIDSVWHTSQTWLVILGAVLFGAFPTVYGAALSSRYGLIILLLLALGIRGLGLEYRHRAKQPVLWMRVAGWGALAVMAVEGVLIGSLCLEGGSPSSGFGLMALVQPRFFPAILLLVCLGLLMGSAWMLGDPNRTQATSQLKILSIIGALGSLLAGLLLCSQLIGTAGPDFVQPRKSLMVLGVAGLADLALLFASLRRGWAGSPLPWGLVLAGLILGTGGVLLYAMVGHGSPLPAAMDLTFLTVAAGILLPPLLAFQIWQYRLERRPVVPSDEEAE
ncbi:cytochrome d ubiquinol oxidase subunit II [Pseudodesulfovibrio sp.]|uniref:cytochrome d ubiquinol oxidase subunit II n=1 Tax=unclassified Pseudodesulfovibrio TaxID=2661612 RepID=UPI003B004EAB